MKKTFLILLFLIACAQHLTVEKLLQQDVVPDYFKQFVQESGVSTFKIQTNPTEYVQSMKDILLTDGTTNARFRMSQDGTITFLGQIDGTSYAQKLSLSPHPLPAECFAVKELPAQGVELQSTDGNIYLKRNAASIGITYQKDGVDFNLETGEVLWSAHGSAHDYELFVHPAHLPKLYEKIVQGYTPKYRDSIQQWLNTHTDYNPPWKNEILQLVDCFDSILA